MAEPKGPGRALRALDSAIYALITVLYAVIVIAMFAQVFFRYALGAPLSWSEEISRYMFVWLVYLGGYVAVIRNAHVGVDYVTRRLSAKTRATMNTVLSIMIIAALGYAAYHGALLTWDNVAADWFTISFLSMAIPYSAVPIGCVLMIFGFVRLLLQLGEPVRGPGETEAV